MKERTPTNAWGRLAGVELRKTHERAPLVAHSRTGNSDCMLELSQVWQHRSVTAVLLNANASMISRTPPGRSALLAHSGSGLADTVNHYPARATAHTGLRDHAIRLRKWGERHRLCRCCDRQGKGSNSKQLHHLCFPFNVTEPSLFRGGGVAVYASLLSAVYASDTSRAQEVFPLQHQCIEPLLFPQLIFR